MAKIDLSEEVPNHLYISDCTSHCRLASVRRFGSVKGFYSKGWIDDEDIHGLKWNERVILTVVAYDRTEGKVIVRNPNGMEWMMDVSKIKFCNKHGYPQQLIN